MKGVKVEKGNNCQILSISDIGEVPKWKK